MTGFRRLPRAVRGMVFGRDPEAYDRARLAYPPRVYAILRERGSLGPGVAAFEIGPGTGKATRELLRQGVGPLTLVEPDRRLVRYLRRTLAVGPPRVRFVRQRFERASLPSASFDLGLAASSFHWLPPRPALRRIARALRAGGTWAAWTNLHGDPHRRGPLHRVLQPLYRELAGGREPDPPSRASEARDRRRQLADLRAVGAFDRIAFEEVRWAVRLSSEELTRLWGTFSEIVTLPAPRRRWFLAELERRVKAELGGVATVPVLTPVLSARRR